MLLDINTWAQGYLAAAATKDPPHSCGKWSRAKGLTGEKSWAIDIPRLFPLSLGSFFPSWNLERQMGKRYTSQNRITVFFTRRMEDSSLFCNKSRGFPRGSRP